MTELNKLNSFIVIGDTHGNFKYIMYRLKLSKIYDTTLFHVGDFGVGFNKVNDETSLIKLNDRLKEHNCQLYVIRGNHDNPDYFDGSRDYSNLHLVPDYTIINLDGVNILMVGGAISIDRIPRLYDQQLMASNGTNRELYWYGEEFILDEEILNDMRDISYVITHTSPHFADPVNKGHIVLNYAEDDETLIADLNEERQNLTTMYEILNKNNNIIKWIYGHFHRSNSMIYENTEFLLLDINELKEIFWGGSASLS
jgi:predicted phosphodiesterase